ncbi:MAG: bifunctional DNA primase/polymerase [Haloglomus sp.]
MTDDPERAVRQYLAKNPDAGVLDVISDFVVSPEHRELVEEILAEDGEQRDDVTEGSPWTAASDDQPMEADVGDTPPNPAPAPAEEIPEPFHGLGEVAFPIPPREKAADRPRTEEHLRDPTDDVLEAYLETGHNWGLSCRGDLAYLDADDPEALADVIDALPETAWQVTGSREGRHYFLLVPGLDEDIPLVDPETGENIGHIKAAEQSYVVGPGSVHPSGNRYGPLHGDTIATVDEEELRDLVESVRQGTPEERAQAAERARQAAAGNSGGDADLAVHDVLSAASCPAGERTGHPFHSSDTGSNFMVDEGGETWRCWRHDCTGNALHLVGMDEGIISCGEWDPTGLDTDTWREIFAAAREAGYDLPEWNPEPDHVAVLPPAVRDRSNPWRWDQTSDDAPDPLTIGDARERCQDTLETWMRGSQDVLVEALPTLGKSSGSIRAAAATDEPVTVLTGRGRKEQYEQLREWCEEQGLDYYTLPAFTHDCPTATGEHGESIKETVRDWYGRGATPQDIHKYAEQILGHRLGCQQGDHDCPYTLKWDFDPEEFDVLIGHYAHAHRQKVTQSRTVVFDEFPGGAYETRLDHRLAGAVTHYLQETDEIPFTDFTDLVENRRDEGRRADALAWLEQQELEHDSDQALEATAGHAAAPLATYTILAGPGDQLGNGWERAPLGDGDVGLYDRETGKIHLLTTPELTYTSGVLALDGTPTQTMWELALGLDLEHRQVLGPSDRREYLQEALDLSIVQTSENIKPYNNADYVGVDGDAALLEEIREQHDQRPSLITSSTAEDEYRSEGILEEAVDEHRHYGNVLGSNQFADTRVGAVIGSTHYGDRFVEKWGAYEGEAIERGDGKGTDLSYGPFGDEILTHMREHEVLQAAMRFGRDGNGATVYVHTAALPEWVPLAGEGRVLSTWSDGRREVLEAARDLGEWTTAELADHPDVSIGERQVREHLTDLHDDGVLDRETEGCGFVWRDDGLHRVSEHGEVDLESVDVDDLSAEESAELARSSYYTWEFRTSDEPPGGDAGDGDASSGAGAATAANGGDRPPDDTE